MESLSFAERVLANPLVYRIWQAPFARNKFRPIALHNDLALVHRVLDIGCGPGTNRKQFGIVEYVGVDINQQYLADAKARHPGHFVAADAACLPLVREQRFDFILINSLLHHLATDDVHSVLSAAAAHLSCRGHVHVLDLVLPSRASLARSLARADRGHFPRPVKDWIDLFETYFVPDQVRPYRVGVPGISLWHMIYLRGRRRS